MKTKSLAADERPENLWAVILAGEDGAGLQAGACAGPARPSDGPLDDSLLRRTLDRALLAVPEKRTVLVADPQRDLRRAPGFPLPAAHAPRLVLRPPHPGAATDILLAVHWIRRQQADATVVILPAEQAVPEPLAFIRHVLAVAAFIERHTREIVIVGARATDSGAGCGWIETSQPIPDVRSAAVWRVRSLRRSAPGTSARSGGSAWLRSTSVIVARADALIEASQRYAPELDAMLETASVLLGTRYERRSVAECHAVARDARLVDVLRAGGNRLLSASRLPPARRSDRADAARWTGWPPAPRGRFDGLVEQHSLQDNVEACLAGTVSPWLPWKAKPYTEITRKP